MFLRTDLACPQDDPLAAGQALQPDRAARMQLVRRDADLGAEAVFVAVGEARRRIDHHRARVDFAEEAHGARVIVRDDRVGVLRPVAGDVLDRRVERVDDPNGDDRGEVLGVPVVLGRLFYRGHQRARMRVTAHLHAFRRVDRRERAQHARGGVGVDEERLHRIAGRVALRLRVVGDADRHVGVGARVDVDVAYAVQMLQHRHARLARDALDQRLAAARYDDVHVRLVGYQVADRRTIRGVDQLHAVRGQPRLAQARGDAASDRAVAVDRLGAAAQDRRVARLEAQPRRIRGDVRPRLVDDADDTERHAHRADLDSG